MNRSQINCNPVNLRFAKQDGTKGEDDKGFAVFQDSPAGWRAAHRQIELDQGRNLTLRQFINKFAPPIENDTTAYLGFVALQFGCPLDTPLNQLSKFALAGIMAAMEGYYHK